MRSLTSGPEVGGDGGDTSGASIAAVLAEEGDPCPWIAPWRVRESKLWAGDATEPLKDLVPPTLGDDTGSRAVATGGSKEIGE
jgi:hypothetical protein